MGEAKKKKEKLDDLVRITEKDLEVGAEQIRIDGRAPRVAIAVPSMSMVHADFCLALSGLTSYSTYSCEIAIMNFKGSMISHSRNSLAERSVSFNSDYTFWLDSDMVFPPDALVRLLAHKKDIIGATYVKRVPPFETLGQFMGPKRDLSTGGLIKALHMPGGVMLVKTDVYKKMKWPFYYETYDEPNEDRTCSEDLSFCRKAIAFGYDIWCDLDLTFQIGHIGERVNTCERPAPWIDGKPLPQDARGHTVYPDPVSA